MAKLRSNTPWNAHEDGSSSDKSSASCLEVQSKLRDLLLLLTITNSNKGVKNPGLFVYQNACISHQPELSSFGEGMERSDIS